MPVSSPMAGIIEEILIPDGDKVTAGAVLCRINANGVLNSTLMQHNCCENAYLYLLGDVHSVVLCVLNLQLHSLPLSRK